MKCRKGFEIKVCRSAAGFYKGTLSEDGSINCRISGYAQDKASAESLPLDRQWYCIENEYCNGGKGCFDGGA